MGRWSSLGDWWEGVLLLRNPLQWGYHWCAGTCKSFWEIQHWGMTKEKRKTWSTTTSMSHPWSGFLKRAPASRCSWLHNLQEGAGPTKVYLFKKNQNEHLVHLSFFKNSKPHVPLVFFQRLQGDIASWERLEGWEAVGKVEQIVMRWVLTINTFLDDCHLKLRNTTRWDMNDL